MYALIAGAVGFSTFATLALLEFLGWLIDVRRAKR